MPHAKIKQLLQDAESALNRGDDVTTEELALIRQLEAEFEKRLSNKTTEDEDTLLENLTEAQAAFAVRHPVTERYIREIIDTLAKMGI